MDGTTAKALNSTFSNKRMCAKEQGLFELLTYLNNVNSAKEEGVKNIRLKILLLRCKTDIIKNQAL